MVNQRADIASTFEDSTEELTIGLLDLRARFDDRREWLRNQMVIVDKQIAAVDFLIDSVTEGSDQAIATEIASSCSDNESSVSALSKIDEPSGDVAPVSGAATAQDISHCETQREAAYVIAEINNGDIDLKSAAPVIKAAGLSKGMLNTIVSSLHNFMSHSEDWVYTGPSAFKLVVRRKVAPKSASEPNFGDEKSSDASVAGVDSNAPHAYEETAA